MKVENIKRAAFLNNSLDRIDEYINDMDSFLKRDILYFKINDIVYMEVSDEKKQRDIIKMLLDILICDKNKIIKEIELL